MAERTYHLFLKVQCVKCICEIWQKYSSVISLLDLNNFHGVMFTSTSMHSAISLLDAAKSMDVDGKLVDVLT